MATRHMLNAHMESKRYINITITMENAFKFICLEEKELPNERKFSKYPAFYVVVSMIS